MKTLPIPAPTPPTTPVSGALSHIVEVLELRLAEVVEDVAGDADFGRLARGVATLLTLERVSEHRRATLEKANAEQARTRFTRLSEMPPLHPEDVARVSRDALRLRALERPDSLSGSLAGAFAKDAEGLAALQGRLEAANDRTDGPRPAPEPTPEPEPETYRAPGGDTAAAGPDAGVAERAPRLSRGPISKTPPAPEQSGFVRSEGGADLPTGGTPKPP